MTFESGVSLTFPKTNRQHGWEAFGPTWIEVDLDVLMSNLAEIRTYVNRPLSRPAAEFAARHGLRPPKGPPKIMVVVKGDAYGHGAAEVASAVVEAGADMLGVSTLTEALELRQAGIMIPVLMINPLTPSEAGLAIRAAITPTVTALEAAERLSAEAGQVEAGEGLPIHIALDTGMSRFGVPPDALPDFAERVASLPGLRLEGLYTHFSAGSDQGAVSLAGMRRQLEGFARAVAAVEGRGLRAPLRHAACSTAVLYLPESYLDLVRVGNLVYGFGSTRGGRSPASPRREGFPGDVPPPRVAEAWALYTQVLDIRDVPAGTGVGYGPDVKVRTATRLATVPVGYAEGVGVHLPTTTLRPRLWFKRLVQRLASWLYRLGFIGRRRPASLLAGPLARLSALAREAGVFSHADQPIDIIGRVSMQQTILKVTDRPEIAVGTVIRVRVPRLLASPRLGRVYFSAGQAVAARLPCGLAEAAAGWDPEFRRPSSVRPAVRQVTD